ncbi:MAG: FAD-dependent thymidylate synthase [Methanobacteriota archaeon]
MKVELLDLTDDSETLIADSARVCYQSKAKDSKSNVKLIEHLRKLGHLSTFEHAKATFKISGISRACSHQLVRHRHFSFSQMSQRYVNERGFEYVTPPDVEGNSEAKKLFNSQVELARSAYEKLVDSGIRKEDARFLLPNAVATEMIVTANFRSLREFIQLRTTKAAQWEINNLAKEMLAILKEKAPNAFGDL